MAIHCAPNDRGPKSQLYGRYGVPCYRIADTGARTLEGYELSAGACRLAGRMQGAGQLALAPFADLLLALDELWPPRS